MIRKLQVHLHSGGRSRLGGEGMTEVIAGMMGVIA